MSYNQCAKNGRSSRGDKHPRNKFYKQQKLVNWPLELSDLLSSQLVELWTVCWGNFDAQILVSVFPIFLILGNSWHCINITRKKSKNNSQQRAKQRKTKKKIVASFYGSVSNWFGDWLVQSIVPSKSSWTCIVLDWQILLKPIMLKK